MRHILVVDDEESIRDIFKQYLTYAGYKVSLAASGEEALDSHRSYRYDAVIADYFMSGIDGLTVLAQFRKDMPDVQSILLSANRLEELASHADVHFLHKPVNLETLVDFLSVILTDPSP